MNTHHQKQPRNSRGQFARQFPLEYEQMKAQDFFDTRSPLDLNDPETRAAIRDISGTPRQWQPVKQEPVRWGLWAVWTLSSLAGIIAAYLIGRWSTGA